MIGVHAEERRTRVMVYSEKVGERLPGWRLETVVHTCPSCGGHNVEAEPKGNGRERFVCWGCTWNGQVYGRERHGRREGIEWQSPFPDLTHSNVDLADEGGRVWF